MQTFANYNPCWENVASRCSSGHFYKDEHAAIGTDFEGGNGADIKQIDQGYYSIRLEPEPGQHVYSGMAYYFCFALRNLRNAKTSLRIRLIGKACGKHATPGDFANQTRHVVLRTGARWQQLDPSRIKPAATESELDVVELEIDLPPNGSAGDTVFVSNFHWWPYSELVQYLKQLPNARVREIGRSFQNRALFSVELGSTSTCAPCLVHAQTPQPSEMGNLACRAMIDFLSSAAAEAAAIRATYRVVLIPETNPDGAVAGYGISDGQGRIPFFEGHLAAEAHPTVTPETRAVWNVLQECRPLLFWEWHSNNWSRRPGHMLLRYRSHLLKDPLRREMADEIEARLLNTPDTFHANWTSETEGLFQTSMGYQAIKHLGAISCMIKLHDKYPLEKIQADIVRYLVAATDVISARLVNG